MLNEAHSQKIMKHRLIETIWSARQRDEIISKSMVVVVAVAAGVERPCGRVRKQQQLHYKFHAQYLMHDILS